MRLPRKTVTAIAATGLLMCQPLSPAEAIGVDNGWSHENNEYLDGGGAPIECAPFGSLNECAGWANAPGYTLPIIRYLFFDEAGTGDGLSTTIFDSIAANFGNGSTAADGIRVGHGPYLNGGSPSVESGTLTIYGYPYGTMGNCGYTIISGITRLTHDVNNFGSGQRLRIDRVIIQLNSSYNWSTTNGYLLGSICNMKATYAHEIGHTVAMGHTMSPGQVMSTSNTLNYKSGFGDKRAERCIYELDLDPNNCG